MITTPSHTPQRRLVWLSSSEWRKVVTYLVLEVMPNQRTDQGESSGRKKERSKGTGWLIGWRMSLRIIENGTSGRPYLYHHGLLWKVGGAVKKESLKLAIFWVSMCLPLKGYNFPRNIGTWKWKRNLAFTNVHRKQSWLEMKWKKKEFLVSFAFSSIDSSGPLRGYYCWKHLRLFS